MNVAPGFAPLPEGTKEKLELLWDQAEKKRAPCIGKQSEFIDYPEGEEPSPQEASKMCFGCPVRALCKQVAKETNATYGVWGGEVYSEQ